MRDLDTIIDTMSDAPTGRHLTSFADPDDPPREPYESVPMDAHPTTMT
ncbi:hypothetical protein [Gluconacetobacter sp.]